MTIKYINKDITEVNEGCILHGVNCSAAMNSGVAAAIRAKWAKVYKEYLTLFRNSKFEPNLLGTIQPVRINEKLVVVNGFTQVRFGNDGKIYADLCAVKQCIERTMKKFKHYDICIPMIGCGLGGLDWDRDIKKYLVAVSREQSQNIRVYYL